MSLSPISGEFVEVVLRGVPQPLLYRVPAHLSDVDAGHIVAVEIGRSTRVAWATRRLDSSESLTQGEKPPSNQMTLLESASIPRLKEILQAESIFPKDQLELFNWMADYYGVTLLEVIETAIPIPQSVVDKLTKPKKKTRRNKDSVSTAETSHIKTPSKLSSDQSQALKEIRDSISKREFSPYLLHGVTGSGKTEVYLQAAESALAAGQSVLIVVPEIALTPQLLDHLTARLHIQLAMLHSEVSSTERWKTWKALLSGELRLAVGARSAIFAPLTNLGLIVVDEEHETSYKQSDNLRYHARDVAVMRAKISGCPIILGSATPSFESLLNASRQRYKLLELPNRVTARPVQRRVEAIKMRQQAIA